MPCFCFYLFTCSAFLLGPMTMFCPVSLPFSLPTAPSHTHDGLSFQSTDSIYHYLPINLPLLLITLQLIGIQGSPWSCPCVLHSITSHDWLMSISHCTQTYCITIVLPWWPSVFVYALPIADTTIPGCWNSSFPLMSKWNDTYWDLVILKHFELWPLGKGVNKPTQHLHVISEFMD